MINMIRSLYKTVHSGERSRPHNILLGSVEASRVAAEWATSQALKSVIGKSSQQQKARPGHGVIVIPGFLGRDEFNQPLVDLLNNLGYKASGWMNGRNTGPRDDVIERLMREVEFKNELCDGKISLVGHSLGGIYAREIARKMPENVEQIITLGSPFNIRRTSKTASSKLFWYMNEDTPATDIREQFSLAPPVPTTSVYSRSDVVIKWKNARQNPSHAKTENIEVYGSHCGLTQNAAVWYLLSNRLAQTAENWQKFDNSGWRKLIFPQAKLTTER